MAISTIGQNGLQQSRILTAVQQPAGAVLQVVSGIDLTQYSTTSNATTTTFSITLASASNKVAVYLWATCDASIGSTVPGANIRLARGGNNLTQPSGFYVITSNGQPSYLSSTIPIMYLDTPATASPSYSISLGKASAGGTNTAYQTALTWILMEIAG